ncbi:hypothetical protein FDZ71_05570, partial [bacterium]
MGLTRATLGDLLSGQQKCDVSSALETIMSAVGGVVEINPDQSLKQIMQDAAEVIVDFLGGQAVVFRFRESSTGRLFTLASYRMPEDPSPAALALEDSVAAEVMDSGDPKFLAGVEVSGFRSMLALPIAVKNLAEGESAVRGAILLYLTRPSMTKTEILVAQALASKVGHVLARRRILEMKRLSRKKEWIVEKVFAKVSLEKGLKMKDLFRMMVEELADMIKIQSCSFFAVSEDGREVVLESGWPESGGYHSVGGVFSLDEHSHLAAAVRQDQPIGDFPSERIYHSYILIKDPIQSRLTTQNLKAFAASHGIRSILYVPLRIGEEVRYLLVFDALERKPYFSGEDIELLIFFGKELTQALEIERLDDILHDFKNPAIALAGFARRIKKLVDSGEASRDKLSEYAEIVMSEATRLQELAMSVFPTRGGERIDLSALAAERFRINREALREIGRAGVALREDFPPEKLVVTGSRLALERVLDNLLNNAAKALSKNGGELAIRCSGDDIMALVEITNSGRMSEEVLRRILMDEIGGRGLGIVRRLAAGMGGSLSVSMGEDSTTFS